MTIDATVVRQVTQNDGTNGPVSYSWIEPDLLPLRTGDMLYFTTKALSGTHFAVLHYSVDGEVSLLGDQSFSATDTVTTVKLPIQAGEGYRVQDGPTGMETVVLLADSNPLPGNIADIDCPQFQSQRGIAPLSITWRGTTPGPISHRLRGLEVDDSKTVALPTVSGNQDRLLSHYQKRFSVVHIVSYGVTSRPQAPVPSE